jgi:hypothetical protein
MEKTVVVYGDGYGKGAVKYECVVTHENGIRSRKAITSERINELLDSGYAVHWNPTK